MSSISWCLVIVVGRDALDWHGDSQCACCFIQGRKSDADSALLMWLWSLVSHRLAVVILQSLRCLALWLSSSLWLLVWFSIAFPRLPLESRNRQLATELKQQAHWQKMTMFLTWRWVDCTGNLTYTAGHSWDPISENLKFKIKRKIPCLGWHQSR